MKNITVLLSVSFLLLSSNGQCDTVNPPPNSKPQPYLIDDHEHHDDDGDRHHDDDGDREWHHDHEDDDDNDHWYDDI